MKAITILGIAAMSAVSFGANLWDQSAMVNMPGAGTGAIAGANLSMLEAGETTYGPGAQATANNIVADDFTIGAGGATVTGLTFWAYQSFATAVTITDVNFAIDSDLTSTALTSGSSLGTVTVAFSDIYRVSTGATTNADRRLQRVDVSGLNMSLGAGTHWLKYNFAGSTAFSGPWTPYLPLSLATNGMNAQQSIANGAFAPLVNATSFGADLAFQVHGDAVPEPATMGLIALGAAFVARRRKNSK